MTTLGMVSPRGLRSKPARVAGILLAAALSAAANADNTHVEAHDLLERMVHASRSLDYVGTFVYRSGSTIQSMRIVHRADAEGSRERLVALSGAAREVIREGEQVTCILPDDEAVLLTTSQTGAASLSPVFGSGLKLDPGIHDFYLLSHRGVERVADREAMVVHVQPRDRYRYGFRFAVDRHSGLLLKSELLHSDDTTLEQIVYTHLELPDSIPDTALEPQVDHDGFIRYGYEPAVAAAPEATTSNQQWTVGWLPAGFQMTSESRRPIHRDRAPVEHRVYSDGLVSISVFIEEVPEGHNPFEGRYTAGAVNAYGRVIEDFQLSVVGEVPTITTTKIAASIAKR